MEIHENTQRRWPRSGKIDKNNEIAIYYWKIPSRA